MEEMGIGITAPQQQEPQPLVNQPTSMVQSEDSTTTREIKQLGFEFDPAALRQAATDIVSNKKTFDENSLRQDEMFLESARILAKRDNPEESMFWDDQQTLDYALEYVGQINYNLPKAISTAVEYDGESEEHLAALAYTLEAYEAKDISTEGFGRLAQGIISDPTTYASIGSFGLAAGVKVAGKQTALTTLKNSLLKTANLAALEAGAYTGVDDAARQHIGIATGKQDEYSPVQTGVAAGVGAAFGKGVGELATKLHKRWGGSHFKTGEKYDKFFSDVVTGGNQAFKPSKPYEYVKQFKDPTTKKVQKVMDQNAGEFDQHIATSIPTFRETQIDKASAIVKTYPEGGTMIDLGGSEGGFVKSITEVSDGKIETTNLDANSDMMKVYEKNPVPGSHFEHGAFQQGWEGVPTFTPAEKYDVVHESMMFQFIDKERDSKLDEIVNNYIKDDGILITEEKFKLDSPTTYGENEQLKVAHKNKYYTKEQQSMKTDEVLVGMDKDQADFDEYIDALRDRFMHVGTYWKSGNFRGVIATNNKQKYDEFLTNFEGTDVSREFTSVKPYTAKDINTNPTAGEYSEAIGKARVNMGDKAEQVDMVTPDKAQAILDAGGKLFVTKDGKAGAYVLPDGYMGGLFRNPTSNFKDAAKVLQKARREGGGKFFDSYANNEALYIKNGYRPVARMKFNPEYAPEGWETNAALKDKPDNVFFVYDPKYKGKAKGKYMEDYDEAYDYTKEKGGK